MPSRGAPVPGMGDVEKRLAELVRLYLEGEAHVDRLLDRD